MNRKTCLVAGGIGCLGLCAVLVVAGVVLYPLASSLLADAEQKPLYERYYAEFNTAGRSLVAEPLGQKQYTDGMYEVYGFTAAGFARDRTYHVWLNYAFERRMLTNDPVSVSATNEVVFQSTPARAYTYAVLFKHGQQIQFALIADDGSQQAYAHVVPFPAVASGPGHCRLSAEYWHRGLLFVNAQGLEPSESVQWTLDAAGQRVSGQNKASTEGMLQIGLPLPTNRLPNGADKISLAGRACTVSTEYGW